jgi:thiol-disulfide isomerase/thioredoxin
VFSLPSRDTVLSWAQTLAFAALLAFGVRSLMRSSSGPKTDVLAPAFSLQALEGDERVALEQLRGAPVLIEAFAPWCGACAQSAPALREAALAKRDKPVQFVSVMLDANPSSARRVKTEWGIVNDVLLDDGTFARNYEISMLPTFILIDELGHVRVVSSGRADRDDIEEWLTKVGSNVQL